MKIRNGFVSNSSSSSFVIYNPQKQEKVMDIINNVGCYDFYELDGVLYTSFISDASDTYGEISELADESYDGSHGTPYDEADYVEFEGDRGFDSVYIPKSKCKDVVEAENRIKDLLYEYVRNYINYNSIYSEDDLMKDNIIKEDSPYFLNRCCEIVGYCEKEDWME